MQIVQGVVDVICSVVLAVKVVQSAVKVETNVSIMLVVVVVVNVVGCEESMPLQ